MVSSPNRLIVYIYFSPASLWPSSISVIRRTTLPLLPDRLPNTTAELCSSVHFHAMIGYGLVHLSTFSLFLHMLTQTFQAENAILNILRCPGNVTAMIVRHTRVILATTSPMSPNWFQSCSSSITAPVCVNITCFNHRYPALTRHYITSSTSKSHPLQNDMKLHPTTLIFAIASLLASIPAAQLGTLYNDFLPFLHMLTQMFHTVRLRMQFLVFRR